MSLLAEITIFFLYIAFGGLMAFWPLVSSGETGRGFHGLISNVSLGGMLVLSACAYYSGGNFSLVSYGYLLMAMVSFMAISLRSRDIKIFSLVTFRLKDGDVKMTDYDQRDLGDWFIYAVMMGSLLLWANEVYFHNALSLFYVLSSLMIMGVNLFMMSLGHYYLVVPKLSAKPLIIGSYLLWAFLLVKSLLISFSVFSYWDYFMEGSRLGDGFMMNWVFFSMRVLWGLLALGILSIFSYKLAKMRSFQSATGVLYTMVFFVFVGELLSGYFYFKFGIGL